MVEALAAKFTVALREIIQNEMDMQLKVQQDAMELQETLDLLRSKLHGVRKEKVVDLDILKWIRRLENIIYDADDILDECHFRESELRRLSAPPSPPATASATKFPDFPLILTYITRPYHFFFRKLFSNRDISLKLKGLNFRMQMLKNQRDKFDLHILDNFRLHPPLGDDYCHADTTPAAAASSANVVGDCVHKDADFMLRLLTDLESGNLLVFAIVGPGGIGKTTMANLIFESLSERKNGFFDRMIRITVSRQFNKVDLLKRFIAAAGDDRRDEGDLVQAFREEIKGKKLFLLLDDVWDAMGLWSLWLEILLRGSCAAGSRVLVTTRNGDAADQMRAAYSHSVQPLNGDEGWELLCRCVGSSPEAEEMKILKNTGLQIVDKCYGNPLAIMSVGSMLCLENKARVSWERLLEYNVWCEGLSNLPNGIHKDIYRVYDSLPSVEMRQCFVYCSLFPDGHEIPCSDLIEMWVAEGIVEDDEAALSCFLHLTRRNVLVPRRSPKFSLTCKMDGLSCSLGRYILKGGGLVVAESQPLPPRPLLPKIDYTNNLRWLSMVIDDGSVEKAETLEYEQKIHEFLRIHSFLRTLLLFNHPLPRAGAVLRNLPCIRLLTLRGAGIRDEQTESIESLVHLRFLDLSENEQITKLPESIGNLTYLQVLRLQSCKELSQLPNSFLNLENLMYFDARKTKIKGLPEGIGKAMPKIRKIRPFSPHVKGNQMATMEDVNEMIKVRSLELEISMDALGELLKRAEEVNTAGILESKRWLRDLVLRWPPEAAAGKTEREQRDLFFEVSDKLSPPEQLENLRIIHYYGNKLPSWLESAPRLPNLRTLHLESCVNMKLISALGQLPCLEHLILKHAPKVTIIGKHFLKKTLQGEGDGDGEGSSFSRMYHRSSFPKLKFLHFEEMGEWEKWEWPRKKDGMVEFPVLQTLNIWNCPKLKALPEGILSRSKMLRKLNIFHAPALRLESLDGLPSSLEVVRRD